MITPIYRCSDTLGTWLIDIAGNVAISVSDVALLKRIELLFIPAFVSTEQAIEWGTHLNSAQRETLLDVQRTVSNASQGETDLQRRVDLATQSQLMREAAGADANTGRRS
jgi:hypothetical protein